MREFCLNIKPFMQPKPHKNPGGDCFACSLTAAMQYLFQNTAPNFDTVWDYFMQKYYMSEKKGLHNSWPGMEEAIKGASRSGYPLDVESDLVLPQYEKYKSNLFYSTYMEDTYTRRLEGWLRSGWIAFTEIHYAGGGPRSSWNAQFNDSDHFIILDGTREVFEKLDPEGSARQLRFYIHVVCSAKGPYWIRTQELMRNYGAAGWILMRKSDTDY